MTSEKKFILSSSSIGIFIIKITKSENDLKNIPVISPDLSSTLLIPDLNQLSPDRTPDSVNAPVNIEGEAEGVI